MSRPADGANEGVLGQDRQARAVSGFDAGELLAYEPVLRRYFRRRADPHEIDDLVQEVFLSLQSRRSEAPVEDLGRYLFTVAGHALARKRGHDRRAPVTGFEGEGGRDEVSPERALISREQLDTAVAVISRLSPRTRQVFVLHRFEEKSYRRIASELGISVSAVEKHIMAALRALVGAGLP